MRGVGNRLGAGYVSKTMGGLVVSPSTGRTRKLVKARGYVRDFAGYYAKQAWEAVDGPEKVESLLEKTSQLRGVLATVEGSIEQQVKANIDTTVPEGKSVQRRIRTVSLFHILNFLSLFFFVKRRPYETSRGSRRGFEWV